MVNVAELREVDYQFNRDDWLTEELENALDVLPSPKHRTTVLRLTEGKLVGRSEEATFKLPDVCAKKTWYGPYRDGIRHQGWKELPAVQKAMVLAEQCLFANQEDSIIENIREAERLLAGAAMKAVMVLEVLMDEADSDETKRKAANDILDRVSLTFSRKTTSVTERRSIVFDLTRMPQDVIMALANATPMANQYLGGEIVEGEVVGTDL